MRKNQIIIIIALILSIIAIIVSIIAIINNNNEQRKTEKQEKDYQVFIKEDATEEDINKLIDKINKIDGVIRARLIDKEETLNNIKQRLGETADQYLDNNSFSNSIFIIAQGTEKELEKIYKILEKEEIVKKVEYR